MIIYMIYKIMYMIYMIYNDITISLFLGTYDFPSHEFWPLQDQSQISFCWEVLKYNQESSWLPLETVSLFH